MTIAKGINHEDSPISASRDMHPRVFVRLVYFTDPKGIMPEFAATTKKLGSEDVAIPLYNFIFGGRDPKAVRTRFEPSARTARYCAHACPA